MLHIYISNSSRVKLKILEYLHKIGTKFRGLGLGLEGFSYFISNALK